MLYIQLVRWRRGYKILNYGALEILIFIEGLEGQQASRPLPELAEVRLPLFRKGAERFAAFWRIQQPLDDGDFFLDSAIDFRLVGAPQQLLAGTQRCRRLFRQL